MTLNQIKPHLGDPERKEWVLCNDCKAAQRGRRSEKSLIFIHTTDYFTVERKLSASHTDRIGLFPYY